MNVASEPSLSAWFEESQQRAITCLERARPAIGGRFGLIRGVWDIPTEPDDPRLFHAAAQIAEAGRGVDRAERLGGGSGITREAARASAVGECVERYAARTFDDEALVTASYAELTQGGAPALSPGSLPLYSERQYQSRGFVYKRFDEQTRLSWVAGRSLVTDAAVLVPACLVFIPFTEVAPICTTISTGLACGLTFAAAALSGLYEVIERDAIMIMWLGQLPCPDLEIDGVPGLGTLVERAYRPSRLELSISDISTDLGVPVAFALAIDRANDGMALNAGAAASAEPERAAAKAIIEAAQGRLWLKHECAEGRMADVLDADRVMTFDDHVRWFGHRQHLRHVDFLAAPTDHGARRRWVQPPPAASAEDRLDQITERLAHAGFDVIVVDITPEDVADLGFTVVKVLVPGLVDLNAHHGLPLKGNPRLYEVPERLGHARRTEDTLSRVPHPFP